MKSFVSVKFALVIIVLLVITGAGIWFLQKSDFFTARINNVILISIDTCRADHLSCYGYPRGTTPNINEIATEGVLFENAISPVPLTLPAHASMLTGTIPSYHGIHDNEGYKLGPSNISIAEVLSQAGFTTGAIVGAFVMDSQFGLDQGFESYNDEFEEELEKNVITQRRGSEVNRFAMDWLTEHKDERFFLFLHYYDPHSRYEPPEPFLTSYYSNLYAGEVAFTDYCIGQVVEKLKEFGLYDSTLIIITSDHGEMLGEHKELTHGYYIYQSAINIPLVIKLPGRNAPRRINDLVGLVDIVPTVCSLLELEIPPGIQGRDISGLLRGKKSAEQARHMYCESMYPTRYKGNSLLGVITEGWKYIQTTRPELYNLGSDPGETNNLIKQEPQQARILQSRLKEILEQTLGKIENGGRVELDEEDRRRLESLGYVDGGGVREEFSFDQSKDDPKDMIEFHLEYGKIAVLIVEEKYDEAMSICESLLSERPGLARIYNRMGKIAAKREEYVAAIGYFEKVLELQPEGPLLYETYNSLGTVLAAENEVDEAIRYYERSLKLRYDRPLLLDNLARLYFRRRQLEQAYVCWEDSFHLDADRPEVLNNLAWLKSVYEDKPFYDPNEAVGLARRACELTEYKHHQMLDTLSVAYAAAGRFDEAVKAAEQALKLALSAEPPVSGADIQEHLRLFKAGRPYREAQ
jgi:arylsulfatase A-like enzyme/Flp pilus assembly protein TadD